MRNEKVNEAKAIAMHKQGVKTKDIAYHLGCKQPAIYRAFRRAGYFTPGMLRSAVGPESNYPPAATDRKFGPTENWKNDLDAEEREIAARRIAPRDPCFRCGARGDFGCGCPKTPLGWRAG